jgi:hypothetical protein
MQDNHARILIDGSRPLAFYRLVGPADQDRGNVLRLIKNVADQTVVALE